MLKKAKHWLKVKTTTKAKSGKTQKVKSSKSLTKFSKGLDKSSKSYLDV